MVEQTLARERSARRRPRAPAIPESVGPAPPVRKRKADRSPVPNVPALDGIRGLAVMWIVLGHCWISASATFDATRNPLNHLFGSLFFGVDFLFIVSGFVLFLPVAHGGSLGDGMSYARRRAARIVPAFYVFLVASYFVARYLGVARGGLGSWVAHAFFLHQEAEPLMQNGFGVNQAMWTMSIEVLFYVTLPFVASYYRRRPFVGLAIAYVIAGAWEAISHQGSIIAQWFHADPSGVAQIQDRMAHAFPSYTVHFALGMTAAWLYVKAQEPGAMRRWRSIVSPITLAGLIGATALCYLWGWEQGRGLGGPLGWQARLLPRVTIFAALILGVALSSPRGQWPATNEISRTLGRVSYGIYLSHMPLIRILEHVFDERHIKIEFLTMSLYVVPLAVLFGIASYFFIEQPARMWARRANRRRTRTPSVRPWAGRRLPDPALARSG